MPCVPCIPWLVVCDVFSVIFPRYNLRIVKRFVRVLRFCVCVFFGMVLFWGCDMIVMYQDKNIKE